MVDQLSVYIITCKYVQNMNVLEKSTKISKVKIKKNEVFAIFILV